MIHCNLDVTSKNIFSRKNKKKQDITMAPLNFEFTEIPFLKKVITNYQPILLKNYASPFLLISLVSKELMQVCKPIVKYLQDFFFFLIFHFFFFIFQVESEENGF